MNWKALGPLLAVILLGALAYVYSPEIPVTPPPPEPMPPGEPPVTADPIPPPKLRVVRPFNPQGVAPQPSTLDSNAPIGPQQQQALYKLEPVADPERLRELGVPESAVEPEDAGVLHKLDRAGLRAAVKEKLEAIGECRAGTPQLEKTAKLEFQIVEIPGRARARVQSIALLTDGGVGRVAFEDCVRKAVDALRFEAPRGGETRVAFPLNDLGDSL